MISFNDKYALITMFKEAIEEVKALEEFQDVCCLTCANFNKEREVCTKARNPSRPPASVIAYGCKSFEYDIPF